MILNFEVTEDIANRLELWRNRQPAQPSRSAVLRSALERFLDKMESEEKMVQA